MAERFLLAVLARARGSRGGVLLTVFGVLLLFATLIIGLASVVGDALLMMAGVGPAINYMETGQGVVVGFLVSVFVILLGVGFMTRATPQPTQSVSVVQQTESTQTARDRGFERLQKRLHRAEQERDRYRDILADPTAKRRHDEELARTRALEVASELQTFWNARSRSASSEIVASFRQRQEWKVDEVRERLHELKMLTPQESDVLTFRPDHPTRIKKMIEVLKNIGMGH